MSGSVYQFFLGNLVEALEIDAKSKESCLSSE